MINYFKNRSLRRAKAKEFYDKAEVQARAPIFYESLGVPDTVDGRFEMIALHCYILMRRLNEAGEKPQAQALFDAFFRHMELSLREMGIGDLAVPKHMKRMMQGFNGRANHYETAILTNDKQALKDALVQNVYGTMDSVEDAHVAAMTDYVMANIAMKTVGEGFAAPDIKERTHG